VKVGLFVPTATPATYHLYIGLLPPFAGLAVNVTEVPVHIGLTGLAAIDTRGVTVGVTVNVPELTILGPEKGFTVINPVVAAAGKRAVICVLLFTK
jgi:hypothetical protein